MKNVSPLIKSEHFVPHSFPVNSKYRSSIATTGVQAGIIVAYGSGNKIVVLINGKYITTILKGHEYDVCAVSFELREPHIVSCDIQGYCHFWHFQENSWQGNRTVRLPSPATSIQWCGFRRTIYYCTKDGFFRTSVTDFGEKSTKLLRKAEVCSLNFDATIAAVHSFGKNLFLFTPTSDSIHEIIKLPSNINSFDFHPIFPIILTYTSDQILRIWKKSKLGTFACSAMLQAPAPGSFIHTPIFFPEKRTNTNTSISKIAFFDDHDKMVTIPMGENGRFLISKPSSSFDAINFKSTPKNIHAYRTNIGTLAIVLHKNSLIVIKKEKKNKLFTQQASMHFKLVFHTKHIIKAKFSPSGQFLATLDSDNFMFVTKLCSPNRKAYEISHSASDICWCQYDELFYIENQNVIKYNPKTKESTKIKENFQGKILEVCDKLYYSDGNKLYSNEYSFSFSLQNIYSVSRTYDEKAILATINGKKINIILLPTGEVLDPIELPVEPISICAMSISKIAVLYQNSLSIYLSVNGSFVKTTTTNTIPMKGIVTMSGFLSDNFYGYDDNNIFKISNQMSKFVNFPEISFIETSQTGTMCLVSGKNFYIYNLFSLLHWEERIALRNRLLHRNQPQPQVQTLEEQRLAQKLRLEGTSPFLIGQSEYFGQRSESINICQNTLVHLLEFSAAYNLSECHPVQIPAIPNQPCVPDALSVPDDQKHQKLLNSIKDINLDVDLYGLRYIAATIETHIPPSYVALWLSFSPAQSQIGVFLKDVLDTSSISKLYIAIGVHQQNILENMVTDALRNTWNKSQNVNNVALLHVAMGNLSKLPKLYSAIGDFQRAEFFKKDFKLERWRKSALKNAYSSLSHHGYEMAAALFLIAGDIMSCLSVICEQLKDPQLAFLVLRLHEKSFDTPNMREFLSKVVWNDDVIPIALSNLIKDGKTVDHLEQFFEKEHTATSYGDPLIPVFQVYFHLTRSDRPIERIANSLLCRGFAPLARFAVEYSRCPYDKPRLPGGLDLPLPAESEHNEEEESNKEESILTPPPSDTESDDDNFDFGGGCGDWDDDDDWSDSSDSDSDSDSDSESKSKSLEESESKSNSDNTILDKETPGKEEKVAAKVSRKLLEEKIDGLLAFFSNEPPKNDQSAYFALGAQDLELTAAMMTDAGKEELRKRLSRFIDFCGILFLQSSCVPDTAADLYGLSLLLFRLSSDSPEAPIMTPQLVSALPNDGTSHSILFGAFVVALWTFSHQLLTQVLGGKIDGIIFLPRDLPSPQALFNADVSPPLFPDSIPNLLRIYNVDGPNSSLDRDRLLIMILIFKRFQKYAEQYATRRDQRWQQLLLDRLHSLMNSLFFFQVAFNSPSLEIPHYKGDFNPLSLVIKESHKDEQMFIDIIQRKSYLKLRAPRFFTFRNESAQMEPASFHIPFSGKASKTRLAISSLHSSRIVVAADMLMLYSADNMKATNIIGFSHEEAVAISQIISHPRFELFMCVLQGTVSLFDTNQRDPSVFLRKPGFQVVYAAFSPNGSKVAAVAQGPVGAMAIYAVELGSESHSPLAWYEIPTQPTAVEWVNSDTIIAVATIRENSTELDLVDVIAGKRFVIPTPSNWDRITVLRVHQQRRLLIAGTANGYVGVFDLISLGTVCVYMMSAPIASLSILPMLVVAADSAGLVTAFYVSTPNQPCTLNFPPHDDLATSHDVIASVHSTGGLRIWR